MAITVTPEYGNFLIMFIHIALNIKRRIQWEHTVGTYSVNIQCGTYSVNIQCGTYSVEHTVWNIQCGTYSVEHTVWNIQYGTYSVEHFPCICNKNIYKIE